MNIIITGASDGIGLRVAKLLDREDASVLRIGRRSPQKLGNTLPSSHQYLGVDLSTLTGIRKVTSAVEKLGWNGVDLIIHNAATAWIGPTASQSRGSLDDVLAVTCVAPIALTHQLLPQVRKAQGKVVFIGSSITSQPCPAFAAYAASKAAIAGFARSLALECQNEVAIQIIHPGPTRTGLHARAGAKQHWIQYFFRDPSQVAREIVLALESDAGTVRLGAFKHWMVKLMHDLAGVRPLAPRHQRST